jgi:hypothetical protein
MTDPASACGDTLTVSPNNEPMLFLVLILIGCFLVGFEFSAPSSDRLLAVAGWKTSDFVVPERNRDSSEVISGPLNEEWIGEQTEKI